MAGNRRRIQESQVGVFAIDAGGHTGVAKGIFVPKSTLKETLTEQSAIRNLLRDSYTIGGTPHAQARQLFSLWRRFYADCLTPPYSATPENVWMVIESFYLSPDASPGGDVLLSTQVAHTLLGYRYGAADEFDRSHANPIKPIQVAWQTPSEALSYATDERLRRWGLWVKGREHERDAFRHLAYFLNRRID